MLLNDKKWVVALEYQVPIDEAHLDRGEALCRLVRFKTLNEAYAFYIKSLADSQYMSVYVFKEVDALVVEK